MRSLKNLRFGRKMTLLVASFAVGFLVFGALAYSALTATAVNGPHYQEIVRNKDLLADVLPPPAYIVETYLVMHLMDEAKSPDELQGLVSRYAKLKDEYGDRQKHWEQVLPPGELREAMIERSREPAEAFFAAVDQEYLPALQRQDKAAAETILLTKLPALYEAHRQAVDDVVAQTTELAASKEVAVASTITWATWGMLAMGALMLAGVCGLSTTMGRFVTRNLSQTLAAVSDISQGNYSRRVAAASTDEIGRLGEAVNHLAEGLAEQETLRQEAVRAKAVVENAPINVLVADKDLKIQYANPASVNQLKALERFLPIKADQLVGQSIDIFHKNPAHQRKLLSDPNNLPHRAQIQVGPETLDLLVSPIRDQRGEYIGPMVTWEVVTEKQRLANETARVTSMMENAPVNVIFADTDLKIRYMNPASRSQLKALEQLLPVKVDQIVGQSIDIFHKNPAHQRKLLADHKNLPHRTQIQLGAEILDLLVSPIFGAGGEYLGPMVTWEVVTQKVNTERGVSASAQTLASSSEELTAVAQQMSASAEETATQANVVSAAAEQVSKNVQTVATGVEEMSASIREIAKNSSDAARVAEQAVKVAQSTNTTIAKLGDSSAEIGKVIKVITSIAEQTNLLALNATIEAARAGEAGKGFAVVANEVKELAKETAKATEDIGQKIEAIQADTRGSVEAIQQIGQIIGQINDISNTIASAVEEQTATTNEIARNVAEAAKGSGEIAQNITSVAQAAQETTQGASTSQQAAAELSRMAADLQQLVTRSK